MMRKIRYTDILKCMIFSLAFCERQEHDIQQRQCIARKISRSGSCQLNDVPPKRVLCLTFRSDRNAVLTLWRTNLLLIESITLFSFTSFLCLPPRCSTQPPCWNVSFWNGCGQGRPDGEGPPGRRCMQKTLYVEQTPLSYEISKSTQSLRMFDTA